MYGVPTVAGGGDVSVRIPAAGLITNVTGPVVVFCGLLVSVAFTVSVVVLAVVTWEAMNLGLVGRPVWYTPSTIPLPFSVFLATNKDWRAIPLAALNIVLAGLIYLPFVRLYARHRPAEDAE